MDILDYNGISQPLILEQFKKQYGPDNAGAGSGEGGQSRVAIVTFPAFSFASNVVPFAITDTSSLLVTWTDGQENKGRIIYGQEFTVVGNAVQLTDGAGGTTDWTPTVRANALGLLNVTVTQGS